MKLAIFLRCPAPLHLVHTSVFALSNESVKFYVIETVELCTPLERVIASSIMSIYLSIYLCIDIYIYIIDIYYRYIYRYVQIYTYRGVVKKRWLEN